MKRILFWVGVVILALSIAAWVVYGCGTERWAVKTFADKDASKVNLTPVATTVSALVGLSAPSRQELGAHPDTRFPDELKTYTVTAYLVGFKLETDEDFHIVISDLQDSSKTMIAEMPSAACVPMNLKNESALLRGQWQARFGKASKKFRNVSAQKMKVQITGIGFFDFLHGQTGVAPNGFELHRMISWKEVQ